MRCPQCHADSIDQVEMVEAVYPVTGVRRPWDLVHVDHGDPRVDLSAVGERFYRCRQCETEWPVEAGTQFIALE